VLLTDREGSATLPLSSPCRMVRLDGSALIVDSHPAIVVFRLVRCDLPIIPVGKASVKLSKVEIAYRRGTGEDRLATGASVRLLKANWMLLPSWLGPTFPSLSTTKT
jgi:hypothetical protein